MTEFPALRDAHLRAPWWLWLLYVLFVVVLGWVASKGGFATVAGVVFIVAFSFQFFTFAMWNGLRRQLELMSN